VVYGGTRMLAVLLCGALVVTDVALAKHPSKGKRDSLVKTKNLRKRHKRPKPSPPPATRPAHYFAIELDGFSTETSFDADGNYVIASSEISEVTVAEEDHAPDGFATFISRSYGVASTHYQSHSNDNGCVTDVTSSGETPMVNGVVQELSGKELDIELGDPIDGPGNQLTTTTTVNGDTCRSTGTTVTHGGSLGVGLALIKQPGDQPVNVPFNEEWVHTYKYDPRPGSSDYHYHLHVTFARCPDPASCDAIPPPPLVPPPALDVPGGP
jgi:hypothetical protein